MVQRNVSQWRIASAIALAVAGLSACSSPTPAKGSVVKITGKPGSFQLLRNGQPYQIQGAGGNGSRELLLKIGGNSTRTWGAENIQPLLDQAHKDGVSVTIGIWLEHNNKFDYKDEAMVRKQFEMCRGFVRQYKDHPALLMWAFGNEMEGDGEDLNVYRAIEDIAKMAKREDPHHPSMTVLAEIGENKIRHINKLCPSIDVIGVNSYGGATSLAERYRKQGGTKPYVVTEFGPLGPWEIPATPWGATYEPTSHDKAKHYAASYRKTAIEDAGNCLGAYAFLWGNKQEATATWFGMLLPDGSPTEAVDVMAEFWTGKARANLAPRVTKLEVPQVDNLRPGQELVASLTASDPEGKPLRVKWMLSGEVKQRLTAGADEVVPRDHPECLVTSDATKATFRMPKEAGAYRVFAYVYDDAGNGGTANVPIRVVKD